MQQEQQQNHGRVFFQKCHSLSQTLLHRPQPKSRTSTIFRSRSITKEHRDIQDMDKITKVASTAGVRSSFDDGSRSRSRPRRKSYDSIREVRSEVPQSFSDLPSETYIPSVADSTALLRPKNNHNDGSSAVSGPPLSRFGGRRHSKSVVDLRRPTLASLQENDAQTPAKKVGKTLDSMPLEVIELILSYMTDLPRSPYAPPNADLRSCLLTSKAMYAATLSSLYKNITLPHSFTFSRVMKQIEGDRELGAFVRRLDFSHYTSIGFGRTRQAASELHNVTPETLKQCLDLTPGLTEFLVHEHIDDELDEGVLKKLFFESKLHALDFCACASRAFTQNFTMSLFDSVGYSVGSFPFLQRLSLHECSTLQGPVFEVLLPRLPNLTHLDVAHTLITDDALASIPKTARITHLNLGRCTQLTGARVVDFFQTHDAVKNSLVVLNLMADVSRYTLLDEEDVEALVPALPLTLCSLNLNGAKITSSTIQRLLPLTKVLEELGLAHADISVADVNSFFRPTIAVANYDNADEEEDWHPWTPCSLRYLDLTGVSSISQMSLVDASCVLVSEQSEPLEVIELGENVVERLKERSKSNKNLGWVVRELGRRAWFVRQPSEGNADDGYRTWKMGARWWGMRKLPVSVQEVGGMYGHYMFKR